MDYFSFVAASPRSYIISLYVAILVVVYLDTVYQNMQAKFYACQCPGKYLPVCAKKTMLLNLQCQHSSYFQGWVFNVVPWLVTIPSGIGSGWVADYLIAKGK